jgi:hypothetical protein
MSKNYNTLLGKLSKAKPLATRNELENRIVELESDLKALNEKISLMRCRRGKCVVINTIN